MLTVSLQGDFERKDMDRFFMMFALVAVLLTCTVSCEQDIKKAPASVENAFNEKYPGATMVEWGKQMGFYNAEFFFNEHEMEAQFDKDGSWLWSKTEILLSEVPDSVFEAAKNYNDGKWNIDDIDYYQRSSGEMEYYRVDYEQDYSDIERIVYIRPDGTIFKLYL